MKNNDFYVLGIESSCDETAASVVKNGRDVLSNVISSQIDIHKDYGGVVPEIASREHVKNINWVIEKAIKDAGLRVSDIDLIGVTVGPGLVGALVIGVSAAKAMSLATGIPLIEVNHMYGHISSNFISDKSLEPPFLSLIVSGGHTDIAKMESYNSCQILGSTRDDAVGEAYDKVARVLDLGYPGGPKIDRLAKTGDSKAIPFKRVMLEKGSLDFSFSGLKTAVLNYANSMKQKGQDISKKDLAASFQEAIIDVLEQKVLDAIRVTGIRKLALAGGVSANSAIRKRLEEISKRENIDLYLPELKYCTDNAAMIASAAYYKYKVLGENNLLVDANPSLGY